MSRTFNMVGGGGALSPQLIVTGPVSGSTVVATLGLTSVTLTEGSGAWLGNLTDYGIWTVTASYGGDSASTTVNVTEVRVYNVSIIIVDPVLANNSPADIQRVARAGTGANYWSVGDKTAAIAFQNKTVGVLNMNGLSACAFILGFNHNSEKEGTGIHFQFGKTTGGVDIAFVDSMYGTYNSNNSGQYFIANKTRYNYDGWRGCTMRTRICTEFFNALPTNWQNVIVGCIKYTDNTGGGRNTASYVTATVDAIFLLSEFEIFGTGTKANSAEKNYQKQYSYYANGNSKVKKRHNATGSSAHWWTRSLCATSSSAWCYVTENGTIISGESWYGRGYAPAFKVA